MESAPEAAQCPLAGRDFIASATWPTLSADPINTTEASTTTFAEPGSIPRTRKEGFF
jgi:hypothetical protein